VVTYFETFYFEKAVGIPRRWSSEKGASDLGHKMNGRLSVILILGVILILAVLLIGAVIVVEDGPPAFDAVPLKEVTPGAIWTTLLTFLLIALFVERAMEVYTAVWREPERRAKAELVRQARVRISVANSRIEQASQAASSASANAAAPDMQDLHAEKEQALKEHQRAVSDIETHRSETRARTTIWSLFLGALIGVAGVRALSFMNPPSNSHFRQGLFIFLDVVVTAALLGGGADGIHKIISVFTTVAEQKRLRLRAAMS
jgi:hypothetical protein